MPSSSESVPGPPLTHSLLGVPLPLSPQPQAPGASPAPPQGRSLHGVGAKASALSLSFPRTEQEQGSAEDTGHTTLAPSGSPGPKSKGGGRRAKAHSRAAVKPLEDIRPAGPVHRQAVGHGVAQPLEHAALGLHVLPQRRVPVADGGLQGDLGARAALHLPSTLPSRALKWVLHTSFLKPHVLNWMWCNPVIPGLSKLRQEECDEPRASQDYKGDSVSKTKIKTNSLPDPGSWRDSGLCTQLLPGDQPLRESSLLSWGPPPPGKIKTLLTLIPLWHGVGRWGPGCM